MTVGPTWFRAFKGDKPCLPRSQGHGIKMVQTTFARLQAQIAVSFGEPSGDIEALRRAIARLQAGTRPICAVCDQDIWGRGHQPECELELQYKEVCDDKEKQKDRE